MTGPVKAALIAATAGLLVMLGFPILITMLTLPGQTAQGFYNACTAALGTRGAIVANPPDPAPTADEVLLKIAYTATTLGFGNQGATVTVAIAMRATGLANAANRTDTATQRYAHSALIDDGAGALGLPLTWGSPAELMTPEVSTALALDHMVEADPQWRDRTPAQLAAQITGLPADQFTDLAITAQARIPTTGTTTSVPTVPLLTSTTPTTTTTPTSQRQAPPSATTLLNPSEASSAASAAPEAANCLSALTSALPPIATRPNPAGPAIAANAQRAIPDEPAADRETPAATPPATATDQRRQAQPEPAPTDSAAFVAALLSDTLDIPIPTTIAEQLRLGQRVATDPDPGDVVYTDITASQGPHLAGIAITANTMATVLPGHTEPETVPIGPNRVIRRIQQGAAS